MDNNTGYFRKANLVLDDFIQLLEKQASEAAVKLSAHSDKAVEEFENFENLVKSDPKMFKTFAALQKKFFEDPEYAAQVDPNFVSGVMLLDLSTEKE